MLRLWQGLPARRKVWLFLSGGMLTLVFDAFIAHFSWSALTMKWTQALPVFYGLVAALGLGAAAVAPMHGKTRDRIAMAIGAIGMVIGVVGMGLHGYSLYEGFEGEASTLKTIGKALKLGPPLFAPAAFAGVGFLLLTLKFITTDHHHHHHAPAHQPEQPPAA